MCFVLYVLCTLYACARVCRCWWQTGKRGRPNSVSTPHVVVPFMNKILYFFYEGPHLRSLWGWPNKKPHFPFYDHSLSLFDTLLLPPLNSVEACHTAAVRRRRLETSFVQYGPPAIDAQYKSRSLDTLQHQIATNRKPFGWDFLTETTHSKASEFPD